MKLIVVVALALVAVASAGPIEQKPAEVISPKSETKPAEAISPKSDTKPAEVIIPKSDTKPAEVISPISDTKPAQVISPKSDTKPAQVISSKSDSKPDGGYEYGFESNDGITKQETGELKEVKDEEDKPHKVLVTRGSYSYVSEDGTPIKVKYTADEKGFHPESDSIPKNSAPARR